MCLFTKRGKQSATLVIYKRIKLEPRSCVWRVAYNNFFGTHVNRRMFTGRGERRATQLATNSNNYAHTYLLVILGRQIIGCEKQGNCGQSWICLFIRCPQNNVVAWKENLSSFRLCLRTWWEPEWGMCSCTWPWYDDLCVFAGHKSCADACGPQYTAMLWLLTFQTTLAICPWENILAQTCLALHSIEVRLA